MNTLPMTMWFSTHQCSPQDTDLDLVNFAVSMQLPSVEKHVPSPSSCTVILGCMLVMYVMVGHAVRLLNKGVSLCVIASKCLYEDKIYSSFAHVLLILYAG